MNLDCVPQADEQAADEVFSEEISNQSEVGESKETERMKVKQMIERQSHFFRYAFQSVHHVSFISCYNVLEMSAW